MMRVPSLSSSVAAAVSAADFQDAADTAAATGTLRRGAIAICATLLCFFSSCVTKDTAHHVVISARDQKMAVLENGRLIATYPVSTSKYGLGDGRGTYRTPIGEMEIATKIGDGVAPGSVFKNRRRTGEVVGVNAAGRDPIVTRILWLRGRERQNANAYSRDIYIHGTPEERKIGKPASYGCIRMRSTDVIHLFSLVGTGAQVTIVDQRLAEVVPPQSQTSSALVQLNRASQNLR